VGEAELKLNSVCVCAPGRETASARKMAMPYASLSPAADHRASPAATASLLPFCRSAPFSSSSA
jgi:hypothetical protein